MPSSGPYCSATCSDTRTFDITGGGYWADIGSGCGAVRPAVRGLYRMTQIVLTVLVEGHILPFELRQHSPVSGCKRRLYHRTQHGQQPGAYRPGPCHRACLRALAHCEFQPSQALLRFFFFPGPKKESGYPFGCLPVPRRLINDKLPVDRSCFRAIRRRGWGIRREVEYTRVSFRRLLAKAWRGPYPELVRIHREAQYSEASVQAKMAEQAWRTASSHPKFACLFVTIVALITFHYFTLLLPTLFFWLVLVPGLVVGSLYAVNQSGYVPAAITDRLPGFLGGTSGE